MAEGFEPYHVPQQSRRDKLRVGAGPPADPATSSAALHTLLPHYDPSLLPSDLLSCAAADHAFHSHSIISPLVKEEGGRRSLIPNSPSSSHHHHMYGLDPPPGVAVNPNLPPSIHDMSSNNNAFLYAPPQTLQNLRDFAAHSYSNNALSLSLSSHDNAAAAGNPSRPPDTLSLPLELNLQRYGSSAAAAAAGGYLIPAAAAEPSRSAVPLGPFTGYSSILKGSRFLRPAQQLLEELCHVGRPATVDKIDGADSSIAVDPSAIESYLSIEDSSSSLSSSGGDAGEVRRKKSRLISMLKEVCRRYKQYYQQMQDVVASFEYVAGFGNAAPYANLALKAMSKHFRSLKNAITDQLQLNKDPTNPRREPEPYSRLGNQTRAISSSAYFDHHQPVWRPQRGLPERAVTVLRAWLFEHFLHPYPTDTDKIMLAKQTGLSRSQVSNWFINARVRLWKPMVEEIHALETQQAHKGSNSQREDRTANNNSSSRQHDRNQLPLASETPSTSTQRVHETVSNKRTRNDLPEFPTIRADNYDPSSHGQHVEQIGGLSNNVSLTLGLHQNNNNNGMSSLADPPFQVNAVQRFGLGMEGTGEAFVLSGYEGQERHFGRDVYGGQLLHDFVG